MGPSYGSPALPVDEKIRNQSSREFKKDSENWAHNDLGSFNPDRWLVGNEQGEIEIDSRAASMQAFGAGIKASYGTYSAVSFVCLSFTILIIMSRQYCFLTMCTGIKLAYLEMRIIYALVIWNLEVLPPPEALFDFKAVDKLSH